MTRPSRDVPPDDIRSAEQDHEREVDVLAVHRQAFRETGDPVEGQEPGPWWFWAAAVGAIAFGGFYMGRYTGVFAGDAAVHAPVSPTQMMAGRSATPPAPARVDGATVYAGTCVACHQTNGTGTAGLFPPLAGSEWVTGDPARLARLVLHGLMGEIEVRGERYDGQMPPWKQLSDAELAAVLSYIRTSWGNSAAAISAEDIARERQAFSSRTAPWTASELGP